jgi:hypothetical protein
MTNDRGKREKVLIFFKKKWIYLKKAEVGV